jgi:hypothetical protein
MIWSSATRFVGPCCFRWEIPFVLLLFCPWASGWVPLGCAISILLFHGLTLPFPIPGYFLVTATCFAILLLPPFALDALGLEEIRREAEAIRRNSAG